MNKKDMTYVCSSCSWIYNADRGDSDGGFPVGTEFKDLPDDWLCPSCGGGKELFQAEY